MARRADLRDLVIDLEGPGEGSSYRVQMTNRDGERNRHVIHNKGDKFRTVGTLLDVIHGKTRPGGDDATLIIASFQFVASGNKRFVSASITWTFTCDDPAVEVAVEKIAPDGSWILDAVTLKVDQTVSTNASISPAAGPISAGSLGGEYQRGTAKEVVRHTTVEGIPQMETRGQGGFDSVRWHLKENEHDEKGICRVLQVGVLLTQKVIPRMTPRPGTPIFRGAVDIAVDKGVWSNARTYVQRVWKNADKEKDDAIIFQRTQERVSGFFDDLIDRDNLAAVSLTDSIMSMSLHENFEDLRKEREERIRKRKELEEQQKQQREEEERRKKEEEEAKAWHEEEERKKKKQEDEEQEDEERRDKARGNEAARTESVQESQPGTETRHVVQPTSPPLPPWVTYIALGIIIMYAWQKLVALFVGG